MSDELKNIIITITDIQKKLTQNKDIFYKLKDDQGTTYNLFTKTKDGNESVAYQGFKILPDEGLGQTIEVSYVDSAYQYQGKTVNSKNIRKVLIADESQKVINVETPVATTMKKETDWDKIAEGKVRHGVAIEAIKLGKELNQETLNWISCWVSFIITGEINQTPVPAPEVGGHVELPPDEINEVPFL